MKSENIELSIIIVNWNGINFLPNCLRSIVENPPSVSYEIVLVDNASSDKSVEWLKSKETTALLKDTNFTLVESKENLGFGRGNNFAIEKTNEPYVFLLNPDTIVKPEAINRLLEALKADEHIGAVAPKLLNVDETLQPSVWYYPPTPLKILLETFGLYKILTPEKRAETLMYSHWKHDERRIVPIVWGAAILFKGDLLRKLKGFDPDFHMYGEDMDICIRLAESGFNLEFVPEAEIIHIGGQSAIQQWSDDAINDRKFKMNMLFEKKHLNPFLFYSNYLTRMLIGAAMLLCFPLMGRETKNLRKSFKLQLNYIFNQDNLSKL